MNYRMFLRREHFKCCIFLEFKGSLYDIQTCFESSVKGACYRVRSGEVPSLSEKKTSSILS